MVNNPVKQKLSINIYSKDFMNITFCFVPKAIIAVINTEQIFNTTEVINGISKNITIENSAPINEAVTIRYVVTFALL